MAKKRYIFCKLRSSTGYLTPSGDFHGSEQEAMILKSSIEACRIYKAAKKIGAKKLYIDVVQVFRPSA